MERKIEYLKHQINDLRKDIESAEKDFDNIINKSNKDYYAIIQKAQNIKALQDQLKGMEDALKAIESYGEE